MTRGGPLGSRETRVASTGRLSYASLDSNRRGWRILNRHACSEASRVARVIRRASRSSRRGESTARVAGVILVAASPPPTPPPPGFEPVPNPTRNRRSNSFRRCVSRPGSLSPRGLRPRSVRCAAVSLYLRWAARSSSKTALEHESLLFQSPLRLAHARAQTVYLRLRGGEAAAGARRRRSPTRRVRRPRRTASRRRAQTGRAPRRGSRGRMRARVRRAGARTVADAPVAPVHRTRARAHSARGVRPGR